MVSNSLNEIKLPVTPIEQSKSYNCGPTALLTVIRYQYGLKLTSNEMDFLMSVADGGADEYSFFRALDVLGYRYSESSEGTLNDLKKCLERGQAPIIHIVVTDGVGHYVVVTAIDDENVTISDPANGKLVTFGVAYFMGVWKIEEKDANTRWYLVITGHSGDKIDNWIKKLKIIQKKVKNSRK